MMIRHRFSDGGDTDDEPNEINTQQSMDIAEETMAHGQSMHAAPRDVAVEDDESQLWGILRRMSTKMEHRFFHRMKDGARDRYDIGRSKLCDIVIADRRVSGVHCFIYCDYSEPRLRVFVQDNSANGTFVNDSHTKLSRNERTELKSGDEIYVVNPNSTEKGEGFGAFLFVNMRDRIAIQKKVMKAPTGNILKHNSSSGGPHPVRHIEDQYIIGEQLGSGMCGQVHRCVHRQTKQHYAVKIINTKKFSLNPGLSPNELQEEAFLMRDLHHPHIIRIQDSFETDHVLYIVMELVTGGDLFDKILEIGRYNEDDARRILLKVMDAVRYLHKENIVHRDLKPENILLTSSNDPTEVKITDFGLAKRTNQDGLKTFCGTPQYFAPEVLRRKSPDAESTSRYGHKADVWSLGVIAYIMLSGSFPFDDDNLFDQIESAHYSLSGTEWATVSAQAKHFIRSLMNLDIEQRVDIDGAINHIWMREYIAKTAGVLDQLSNDRDNSRSHSAEGPRSEGYLNKSVSRINKFQVSPIGNSDPKVSESAKISHRSVFEDLKSTIKLAAINTSALSLDGVKPANLSGGIVVNTSPTAAGTLGLGSIFWSNKASLVKLVSLKNKSPSINMVTYSPQVDRPSVAINNTTGNVIANTYEKVQQKTGIVTPNYLDLKLNVTTPDMEMQSKQVNLTGRAGVVSATVKRKRGKNKSSVFDGKSLSDDEIEDFSDDDHIPQSGSRIESETKNIVLVSEKNLNRVKSKIQKTDHDPKELSSKVVPLDIKVEVPAANNILDKSRAALRSMPHNKLIHNYFSVRTETQHPLRVPLTTLSSVFEDKKRLQIQKDKIENNEN